MNIYVGTGWIPSDGEVYYGPDRAQIVYFDLVVPGDEAGGEETRLQMRLEGDAIERWGQYITRGRMVIVHARPKNVPLKRHDIVRGEKTVFSVIRAEFPNRTVAKGTTEDAESAEPKSAEVAA